MKRNVKRTLRGARNEIRKCIKYDVTYVRELIDTNIENVLRPMSEYLLTRD